MHYAGLNLGAIYDGIKIVIKFSISHIIITIKIWTIEQLKSLVPEHESQNGMSFFYLLVLNN